MVRVNGFEYRQHVLHRLFNALGILNQCALNDAVGGDVNEVGAGVHRRFQIHVPIFSVSQIVIKALDKIRNQLGIIFLNLLLHQCQHRGHLGWHTNFPVPPVAKQLPVLILIAGVLLIYLIECADCFD